MGEKEREELPEERVAEKESAVRRKEDEGEGYLTSEILLKYLEELRGHLIVPVVIFLLTFVISVPFSKRILQIFLHPFRDVIANFVFTRPVESFWVHVKVSAYLSFVVTFPVFIWRLWLFVSPALYERERKLISFAVLMFLILFIGGFVFGYFFVLPISLRFLVSHFSSDMIRAMISISDFVSFCLKFSVAFGIAFQAPVVVLFMSKTELVRTEAFARVRPYVVVFAFVISAIITPTADALTQVALAVPLIVLWELGVLLAKVL